MLDNQRLKSKAVFISILLHLVVWILLSTVMFIQTNRTDANDQKLEHTLSEKKTLELVQVTLAPEQLTTESSTESERVNTHDISNKTIDKRIFNGDRVEQLDTTSVIKQVNRSKNINSEFRPNKQVDSNRKEDSSDSSSVKTNNINTDELYINNTVNVQKNNNSQPPNSTLDTRDTIESDNSQQTNSSQVSSTSNQATPKPSGNSANPSSSNSNTQGNNNGSSSDVNPTVIPNNTNTNAIWSNYKQAVFTAINSQQTYPKQAELRRIEGTVLVKFTVTKQGKVNSAIITKRSDSELLNNNAQNLFKRLTLPKPPPDVINLLPKQLSIPLEYKLDK